MRHRDQGNSAWRLLSISLAAGWLTMASMTMPAHAGHFIMGAPGVLVVDVTVNGGGDCFQLGDIITIRGHGFGSEAGDRVIAYATQGPMPVDSWTDAEIKFHIPTKAEEPKLTPIGDTLMILSGEKPFILYGQAPAFCGARK